MPLRRPIILFRTVFLNGYLREHCRIANGETMLDERVGTGSEDMESGRNAVPLARDVPFDRGVTTRTTVVHLRPGHGAEIE